MSNVFSDNTPVVVGVNCYFGLGAKILGAVKIGNNVTVGANAVVTKDIPDNVVAAGNPCKVIRKITEEDKKYYFKKLKVEE